MKTINKKFHQKSFSVLGDNPLTDMEKDTIFTPTSCVPKLFYPKKCVNYDKSEFSTNSLKGSKDQNSEKFQKERKNSQCAKKCNQNCEIATLLTFLTKKRKNF